MLIRQYISVLHLSIIPPHAPCPFSCPTTPYTSPTQPPPTRIVTHVLSTSISRRFSVLVYTATSQSCRLDPYHDLSTISTHPPSSHHYISYISYISIPPPPLNTFPNSAIPNLTLIITMSPSRPFFLPFVYELRTAHATSAPSRADT